MFIKLPIVGHFEFSFPPPPSRATYNFHPKRKMIDEEQTLKRLQIEAWICTASSRFRFACSVSAVANWARYKFRVCCEIIFRSLKLLFAIRPGTKFDDTISGCTHRKTTESIGHGQRWISIEARDDDGIPNGRVANVLSGNCVGTERAAGRIWCCGKRERKDDAECLWKRFNNNENNRTEGGSSSPADRKVLARTGLCLKRD